jgi:hypothetical protein
MMNIILSKNDSLKNNHTYSHEAIRGMCGQLSSLKRPFLAGAQLERPSVFEAMKNFIGLQNSNRTTKWAHAEALVKFG